jgi:hypothetical protein
LAAAAAAIVLMILIGIVANEDGGAPEEPPPNTAEPPVAAQPAGTPGRLRLPGSELQQARILSIQPMEDGRLRVRYVPDGASEPVEDVIAMPEDAAVDVDLRSESAAEDP